MDIFSENLIKNAQDLNCIGINELSWKYTYVIEAIRSLELNNFIILGGDVYKIDCNEIITPTVDSWYFNRSNNKDDVIESCKKAIDYIRRYHNKNGENFYYALTYESLN